MSFLASSIFGHEFINYRKNMREADRIVFSYNVRKHFPGMIPVVIDSVDQSLSLALNNCDASMPERMWKYGKEYTMSVNTTIDEVLKEINKNITVIGKKLILGLEDGTLLKGHEVLGQIYKKNKNNKDQILYLLLTQEKTIYGYILSILRYLGILPSIKSEDKIIIKKDAYDIKELKEETANAYINYLYEIDKNEHADENYTDENYVKEIEVTQQIQENATQNDNQEDKYKYDTDDLSERSDAIYYDDFEQVQEQCDMHNNFNRTFYDTDSFDDNN